MNKKERSRYPDNWEEISKHVRYVIYDNRCQMCGLQGGELYPGENVKVVIDCCHIIDDYTNHDISNLIALCKRCHWNFDNTKRGNGFYRAIKSPTKVRMFMF